MKAPVRAVVGRTCRCFQAFPPPPRRSLSVTSAAARKGGKKPNAKAANAKNSSPSETGLWAPVIPQPVPQPVPQQAPQPAPQASSSSAPDTYHHFRLLVQRHLQALIRQLRELQEEKSDALLHFALDGPVELHTCATNFAKAIDASFGLAAVGTTSRSENPLFWGLRHGFVRGNTNGLAREITYAFRSFAGESKYYSPHLQLPSGKELTDFRFPHEWFPATRAMHRTVHLHVGPTNSGKTYNALKALETARTGVYAGPLRLLAHEVYTRLTAKNKRCALLTGEEQRIPDNFQFMFAACTVEMTPLNDVLDVAVIDEIQMIADEDRGFAWAQAFLGVQAREVHLCGEERTVDLIQNLCRRIGDTCVVHRYNRLSPLRTMRRSLGDLRNLERGDAVVSFSRVNLHALKQGIEKQTGRRCAVVYGSLPPETRAEQASLFNNPDNEYDYLVASDAIGMGLNLEIKRVIFEAITKFDGTMHRDLGVPDIKQIGGRAGRFRSAAHEIKTSSTAPPSDAPADRSEKPPGLVTTLDPRHLARVQHAFTVEVPQIKVAGILPPASSIEEMYSLFPPGTPLSHVLVKIRQLAKVSDEFFLCDIKEWIEVADAIEDLPMPIHDRCTLLNAPVSRDTMISLRAFAKCISQQKGGHLLEIEGLDLDVLDKDPKEVHNPRRFLDRLETTHKSVTLYLWLTYRYQGIFTSQKLAFRVKELLEERINQQLDRVDYRPEARAAATRRLYEEAKKRRLKQGEVLPDLDLEDDIGDDAEAISAHILEGIPEGGEEPMTENLTAP
ncbi:hypothetical protein RB595_001662 [Gaeumannomyces hyphopodioides]